MDFLTKITQNFSLLLDNSKKDDNRGSRVSSASSTPPDDHQNEEQKKNSVVQKLPPLVYDPYSQKQKLFYSNFHTFFEEHFIKELENMMFKIQETFIQKGIPEIWDIIDLLEQESVPFLFKNEYLNPLEGSHTGTIKFAFRSDLEGKEEFVNVFRENDNSNSENQSIDSEIYVVDFSIASFRTNTSKPLEICLCDGNRTYEWLPFELFQVQSQIIDIEDKKPEKETATAEVSAIYEGQTAFTSFLCGSGLEAEPLYIRNPLWDLYLGDITITTISGYFHHSVNGSTIQSSNSASNTEKRSANSRTMSQTTSNYKQESQQEWTYIEKNFYSFIMLFSIKDSACVLNHYGDLRSAITKCILKSVGKYFRIEQKYGKMIEQITLQNISKTKIKDLRLKIRSFEYNLIDVKAETNVSTEIQFEIDYAIIYRKLGTDDIISKIKQEFNATHENRVLNEV